MYLGSLTGLAIDTPTLSVSILVSSFSTASFKRSIPAEEIERFRMTYSSVPFTLASISPVVACPSPFKTAGAPLCARIFLQKKILSNGIKKLNGIFGYGLEFHLDLVPAPATAGSGTGFGGGIME